MSSFVSNFHNPVPSGGLYLHTHFSRGRTLDFIYTIFRDEGVGDMDRSGDFEIGKLSLV